MSINLEWKNRRLLHAEDAEAEVKRVLEDGRVFKAVTVAFSDIEGRLHTLDYDKNFLLKNADNLTFDGSSIRGFTPQAESDLRLAVDWPAAYVLPHELFGNSKILVFGIVKDRNGDLYESDLRGRLKQYLEELKNNSSITAYAAAEIEGFLFFGQGAEKEFNDTGKFELATTSGYYNALPNGRLREFIDLTADAQRSMGFENEKDHPEVAPSQFELNWGYTEALIAADQIQLYKLICRVVADNLGMTASFLPKPVVGINGSGMHTNLSLFQDGRNLFYNPDRKEPDELSEMGTHFINRILNKANDLCLVMNSSVNSYRRLDPAYEAPNEIFSSCVDRGAMIRIPIGNHKSARVEVRAVSPDANPYLLLFSLISAGLDDQTSSIFDIRADPQHRKPLPNNIYTALNYFRESTFMRDLLGHTLHHKYAKWKQEAADRCAMKLGTRVKAGEVMFHHEITNQNLWNLF